MIARDRSEHLSCEYAHALYVHIISKLASSYEGDGGSEGLESFLQQAKTPVGEFLDQNQRQKIPVYRY